MHLNTVRRQHHEHEHVHVDTCSFDLRGKPFRGGGGGGEAPQQHMLSP